ncbi:beta-ketoacyl synthase chain length factor [Dyadobacter sp. CY326]|uniref:beta-ketoacyl synthase chain length factor n=1 Tax=Dyadobacter sp. CY326 TaxID=2907300 RepID=UPI001F3827D0|nr:beta-ketoacyl synthase chain length factor [Dyadobacter sp. CY326]MCE7065850.1 beta-ketoacyl synthase chain length factor [Dyadobacter sp. CY326]
MYYITAASTISHQPTFQNEGFSALIGPLEMPSTLASPDYKGFIEASLLRRMSKILRMSVACAKDCISQAGIEQPDAIIVGTGLGCLLDTEKFLNNVLTIEGMLPPTSFIQSTHNTMAGQISLSIGNHGYNMTHTQNSLSFEHALLDAMLLVDEGEQNVLIGAADEAIDFLSEVSIALHLNLQQKLTSGASFFMLSREKSVTSFACVKDTVALGLVTNAEKEISAFLQKNDIPSNGVDLLLFSGSSNGLNAQVNSLLEGLSLEKARQVDYLSLSGIYPTASAFAVHYAADKMKSDRFIKTALICNTLIHSNLGLTLLQSVEA